MGFSDSYSNHNQLIFNDLKGNPISKYRQKYRQSKKYPDAKAIPRARVHLGRQALG